MKLRIDKLFTIGPNHLYRATMGDDEAILVCIICVPVFAGCRNARIHIAPRFKFLWDGATLPIGLSQAIVFSPLDATQTKQLSSLCGSP